MRPTQLQLRNTSGWGGRRAGAGRKAAPHANVAHHRRPLHAARHPVHVTWRAVSGLASLRGIEVLPELVASIAKASSEAFRVVHFSIQDDHLHLVVEASDRSALRLGLQGLGVRLARATNRVLRRSGRVLGDRYHARALRTPREVKHALAYVLQNFKKHQRFAATLLDPCSSAVWFDGFRERAPLPLAAAPVRAPHTWLCRVGWRRHGLLSAQARPAPR